MKAMKVPWIKSHKVAMDKYPKQIMIQLYIKILSHSFDQVLIDFFKTMLQSLFKYHYYKLKNLFIILY